MKNTDQPLTGGRTNAPADIEAVLDVWDFAATLPAPEAKPTARKSDAA